ncbi:MAG TPA: anti-sigma factor [Ornithinibacter sp.]|uniref:anti-sigma factor domain-containing protein n=1 Tax=Ornithinibacter sp. TaxID=2862748 RepID=UPI002B7FA492|nr:anti-sigma factor [Ornithinibacter sp.]HNV41730.1 anti-sigma factor [Ornithinibacter sp.]HOB80494.1 anti-sigma factor [Ornithinibacter sp.]HOT56446.1 anti-sigma factor [Ornithinibacter sp.]HPV90658.1 anti-sigma factor [Ornithinibacter sp.]HQA14306.1 anti-sigma factor [Ornithinibacter sp.]
MTHPDDDMLAALALGESTPNDVAAHVGGCAPCSREVTALRSTLSVLREPVPALIAPPASVWDAVLAEIDAPETAAAPPTATVAALPAAPTAVDHAVAAPATAQPPTDELATRRENRRRGGIPLAWVAGAAAAGILLGIAGGRLLGGEDPAPAPITVASTSLDTLDTGQVKGSADIVRLDGQLDLAVRTEPIDPRDGYLEVWLINKDLERMVSIGVLRPDAPEQTFAIDQALIDQGYVIVDISREGFDAAPQHSGDSVVRGTLAT